jgi:CRISPR-associated endonuclease/helicase Cas3
MSELQREEFAGFVQEVHGRAPFPWQERLVEEVAERRQWPAGIDIPTGLGKTSVIDAAIFISALEPSLRRRRLFFVVDRRLVVDEAFDHARVLAAKLASASPGSVGRRIGEALVPQGFDGPPLEVTRMRGGVTWASRWVERPDSQAVVVGTVDQVGSRLLFRGYGVGPNMVPIDAALVGTDSLIIVDEAHLADAFLETVSALRTLDHADPPAPLPVVIRMSATPGRVEGWVHRIGQADEEDPVARARLRAPKTLYLSEVATSKAKAATDVPEALATWATRLASPDRGDLVAIVANTVARARSVFELLRSRGLEAVLLTGRIRPVDREYMLGRWYPRIRAGRERPPGPPTYLVATQTVEVGANLDFDHLVTESPSLDALVQRLGRLNRFGERSMSTALAVHDSSATDPDPVYGLAKNATWAWLTAQLPVVAYKAKAQDRGDLGTGLDASPSALGTLVGALAPEEYGALLGPKPYVPVLFGQTLDAWARTSPRPDPDTPVDPFLHGIDRSTPDVTVAWRDLPAAPDAWGALVDFVPPVADEALEVPIHAVRRWLSAGAVAGDFGDLDATAPEGAPEEVPGIRAVLRYRGVGDWEVISSPRIRPGDLVVVPGSYGGCDPYGWDPSSSDPVADVADLADRRGRPVLRVGSAAAATATKYHPELEGLFDRLLALAAEDEEEQRARPGAYREAIREALLPQPPEQGGQPELPLVRNLRRLARGGSAALAHSDPDTGAVRPGFAVLLTGRAGAFAEDTSALGSSLSGKASTLAAHQAAVRRRAEEFARNLGLGDRLVETVATAAGWHDEGKRDPRFQAMLHGGDRLAAEAAEEPLAKSGMNPADRTAFAIAQRRSGYPRGMRHEGLSARIAAVRLEQSGDVDPDLLVHLVASHHGRSRPLLPPVHDMDPTDVEVGVDGSVRTFRSVPTVDWDAPSRFATLNRRYGRWGLALLETIVRLSDIWCSSREEEG